MCCQQGTGESEQANPGSERRHGSECVARSEGPCPIGDMTAIIGPQDALSSCRRVCEWLAAALEMRCRETGCGFDSRALRFSNRCARSVLRLHSSCVCRSNARLFARFAMAELRLQWPNHISQEVIDLFRRAADDLVSLEFATHVDFSEASVRNEPFD